MGEGRSPSSRPLPIVGWREWVRLVGFELPPIKAKIDTGARSSALHATDIEELPSGQVRFVIHPHQRRPDQASRLTAPLLDRRQVRSSSGEAQLRPVVRLEVELGGQRWPVEVTLARRDRMGFRMLLGRTALRGRFLVDPSRSFIQNRTSLP